MKLIFAIALLAAGLVQSRAAGTYLLLTQTNALAAGITNAAKSYSDATFFTLGSTNAFAAGITNAAKAYTDSVASTNNANWVKVGTTNSSLAGKATMNGAVITNNLTLFGGSAITAMTGSGALVGQTSPTLATPTLGVATSTRVGIGVAANSQTLLQAAGSGVFTGGEPDPGDGTPAGVRIGYSSSDYGYIQSMISGTSYKRLLLQPNGGSVLIPQALEVTGLLTNTALTASRFVVSAADKTLVSTGTSAALLTTLSDETGTGLAVFNTSPTFNTSITITNGSTGSLLTLNGNSANTWLLNLNVGGTSFGGVTNNGSWLFPDGTASNPGFGWASDFDGTGTGFFRRGANVITFTAGGTAKYELSSLDLQIANGTTLSWAGTTIGTTSTTILRQAAAATLQMGTDAASPVDQTFKAHDGSGTDKDGSDLTITGGKGTGTGRGGDLVRKTSLTTTTGSTAQTQSTREYISAKFVDLTESTATTIFNLPFATATYVGLQVTATTFASDGTDHQAITDTFNISAVNKAGTVTATITAAPITSTTAASSVATLATTWTVVANGASIDVKCSAVSSLTQTVLRTKWMIVALNSNDAATVTPQ